MMIIETLKRFNFQSLGYAISVTGVALVLLWIGASNSHQQKQKELNHS